MKNLVLIISIATLSYACNKMNTVSPEVKSGYTIVNNGNAALTEITDTADHDALKIDQAIPSVANQTYFSNMPIMFFMNDKLYLNSIYDNFEITEQGIKVKGTIAVNEAANGNAIITFTPTTPFSVNKLISITIKKEIRDDGGNKMTADFVMTYTTKEPSTVMFDDNKDFERGLSGVTFIGDGGIVEGKQGTLLPYQGMRYGAISTGVQRVSSGTAIGDASSMMFLGPISSDLSSFSFQYDFISCEFNDYLNSKFDDVAMVTIYGPKGTYSQFITSVKTVGVNGNTVITHPRLPDGGDSYVGHTGWQPKTISFKNVGKPAFIIFTVTDVLDKQLSSILAIDSLSY